jgi:2-amino-4-hydroxy-6-hydroxymethyldihydropteridine diphosphokinase
MYAQQTVFIGSGSNMGESVRLLEAAALEMDALPQTRLLARSSIFCTEPQGDLEQPWFFNQALKLTTSFSPLGLLKALLEIENRFGRKRGPKRYGPRSMDLDILLYGDMFVDMPELRIPHPRLVSRAFVLIPLLEISPNLILPDGKKAADILAGLDFILQGKRIWQKS